MARKFISLVLVLILVCTILVPVSASSVDQIGSYTFTAPYVYPVLPGTDEWQSLNIDQRIAVSMWMKMLWKI